MADAVVLRGGAELSLRFDTFPEKARQRLEDRIASLTEALQARIEGAAPQKTGALRSEIKSRMYADNPNRVAGYVSVYAPGVASAYAKAATLEYGTSKPRRIFKQGVSTRLGRANRRVVKRMSKPARIQAFRYLRGPFEDMEQTMRDELNSVLAELTDEDNE